MTQRRYQLKDYCKTAGKDELRALLTDKELDLIKANGTKRWNYDAYAKKGVPSKRPNITNIRREIAVIKTELTKRGRRL